VLEAHVAHDDVVVAHFARQELAGVRHLQERAADATAWRTRAGIVPAWGWLPLAHLDTASPSTATVVEAAHVDQAVHLRHWGVTPTGTSSVLRLDVEAGADCTAALWLDSTADVTVRVDDVVVGSLLGETPLPQLHAVVGLPLHRGSQVLELQVQHRKAAETLRASLTSCPGMKTHPSSSVSPPTHSPPSSPWHPVMGVDNWDALRVIAEGGPASLRDEAFAQTRLLLNDVDVPADRIAEASRWWSATQPTWSNQQVRQALTSSPKHTGLLLQRLRQLLQDGWVAPAHRVAQALSTEATDGSVAFVEAWQARRMLLDDDDIRGLRALALAYADRASRRDVPAPLVEAVAEAWWEQGDAVDALAALHPLVIDDVTAGGRLQLLTRKWVDEGRIDRALDVDRRRLRLFPQFHLLADEHAVRLRAQHGSTTATSFLRERIRRHPFHPAPVLSLARIALLDGDVALAKRLLDDAATQWPSSRTVAERRAQLPETNTAWMSSWLQPPEPESASAEAVSAGGALLQRRVLQHIDRVGRVLTVHDIWLQVKTPEVVQQWEGFSFPFVPQREVATVAVAEGRAANGEALARPAVRQRQTQAAEGVYDDVAELQVSFAGLQPDDVLHLQVRVRQTQPLPQLDAAFSTVMSLSSKFPVDDVAYAVFDERQRPLTFGGQHRPQRVASDVGDVLVVQAKDLSALQLPPGSPPWWSQAEQLSVSTFASHAQLSSWMNSLVAPQLQLNAQLQARAETLTSVDDPLEEKVVALMRHVQQSSRYVGLELGPHGHLPYPVVEVSRRGYGDCKDKAALLVALLRHVGVDAKLTLVRTADLGVLVQPAPALAAYNHAVVYVPALQRYVDVTTRHAGLTHLPLANKGASALHVDDDNAPSVTTPAPTGADNRWHLSARVAVDQRGQAEVAGRLHVDGGEVELVANLFVGDLGHRRLQAFLSQRFGAFAVRDVEVAIDDDGVVVRFSGNARVYGQRRRGSLVLPASHLVADDVPLLPPTTDAYVPAPVDLHIDVQVVLPDGVQRPPPSDMKKRSSHLQYAHVVQHTDVGHRVNEHFVVHQRHLPATPASRDLLQYVGAQLQQRLVLPVDREGS